MVDVIAHCNRSEEITGIISILHRSNILSGFITRGSDLAAMLLEIQERLKIRQGTAKTSLRQCRCDPWSIVCRLYRKGDFKQTLSRAGR
jgi:hypothetical protein